MAMFENSVKWRREFGIQKLLVDYLPDIKSEGAVGKNYVHGKDKMGRPVIYMKPRLTPKKMGTQAQQMRHLVYTLERAIADMEGSSVEKYVLLIDFKDYSLRNAPSMSVQRETISILQDQYPERLGLALCVDAPMLFSSTFKMVKPFIDSVTASKIVFVSGAEKRPYFEQHFDLSCLEQDYSGNDPHQYDQAKYFETIPNIVG
jgi:polyribonucleotide 5'-hydroxyl-kinase